MWYDNNYEYVWKSLKTTTYMKLKQNPKKTKLYCYSNFKLYNFFHFYVIGWFNRADYELAKLNCLKPQVNSRKFNNSCRTISFVPLDCIIFVNFLKMPFHWKDFCSSSKATKLKLHLCIQCFIAIKKYLTFPDFTEIFTKLLFYTIVNQDS